MAVKARETFPKFEMSTKEPKVVSEGKVNKVSSSKSKASVAAAPSAQAALPVEAVSSNKAGHEEEITSSTSTVKRESEDHVVGGYGLLEDNLNEATTREAQRIRERASNPLSKMGVGIMQGGKVDALFDGAESPDEALDGFNLHLDFLKSKLSEISEFQKSCAEMARRENCVEDWQRSEKRIRELEVAIKDLQANIQDVVLSDRNNLTETKVSEIEKLLEQKDLPLLPVKPIDTMDKQPDEVTVYLPTDKTFEKADRAHAATIEARYAVLDQRLYELEDRLGLLTGSAISMPFPDVCTAVQHMLERILMLDPKRLDSVNKQVIDLNRDLGRLSAQRQKFLNEGSTFVDPEEMRRVEQIFTTMENWKSSAHLLPHIIAKMRDLNVLRQEASTLELRAEALETQNKELSLVVESTRESVNELLKTLAANEAKLPLILSK